MAIIQDLQQVAVLSGSRLRQTHVVNDQQTGFGKLFEQARQTAVDLAGAQFSEQFWRVEVQCAVTIPAGLFGQGASQIGLADAGRTGDNTVLAVFQPVTAGQMFYNAAL